MPKAIRPVTVHDAVPLFLADRRGEVSHDRLDDLRSDLGSFVRHCGGMLLADLTPGTVRTWVKRNPAWVSTSTRRKKISAVVAMINFAVAERLVTTSPIAGLTLPPEARREALIEPHDEDALVAAMTPATADFFKMLMLTGRRPDEVANARKDEVVVTPEGVILRLSKHKNRKKTGRPADVYLSPAAADLVQRRLETPGAYLFTTETGRRWAPTYFAALFRQAAWACGLPDEVQPMSARHSYITRSLIRGVPLAVVAASVGNSPEVLVRHYSHVDKVGSKSRFQFAAMAVV